MTSSAAPARAAARALAAAATLLALAAPAQATEPERSNFDRRPEAAAAPGERARDRLRERLGRFGALTLDERSGTVRSVGRLDGTLTGPSDRDGASVALGYLREHATAFGLDGNDLDGLRLAGRSVVGDAEYLSWEQRYRGVPAADAELEATVTDSGRLLALTGPPAADLAVRSVEPAISARTAYAVARRSAGATAPAAAVASGGAGPERRTRFEDGGRASLTLYRGGNGYRLAWRVLAPVSSTGVYDVLVDARSGAAVRRANRVKFANAKVFRYTPAAGTQENEDFSANGWLAADATTLDGPNAHVFTDVHDVVGFDEESKKYRLTPEAGSEVSPPYDSPLQTVPGASPECPGTEMDAPTTACTWNPDDPSSWLDNRKQSATQLFYFVNLFHDYLENDPEIHFTEGNFERIGTKPLGNPNSDVDSTTSDPVIAQTLDGAATAAGLPDNEHINNSNFLTLPDGLPGLMQMYLWKPPDFGAYDGSNDASLVFHEYTHGMTGRLITDAQGYGALDSAQAGAMGEGWSDFYAMDYLVAEELAQDDPGAADVRLGEYLDNGDGALVRSQPIDCEPAVNPIAECPDGGTTEPDLARDGGFTYADFGQIDPIGAEFHADGEIWAQTLWSIRNAVGVAKARRYITNAMRMSPPEPSFLDMRNAILQASTDEADDEEMWKVFASRGMGYFAQTTGGDDVAPMPDFTDPSTLTGEAVVSGKVLDKDGEPVEDAEVGITGLGDEANTFTDEAGHYALSVLVADGTSHDYPALQARKPAYLGVVSSPLKVKDGETQTIAFSLERDWSSAAGGAAVERFSGLDFGDEGCGPGGLIDDDPGTVWGTLNPLAQADDPLPPELVVDLGAPIEVERIAIDPAAGCGDDASAALGGYRLRGSTGPDGPFVALGAPGKFSASDNGLLNDAFTGSAPRIRYVALQATSAQGGSSETFVDVAEMHVARTPNSAIGPSVETAPPQGISTNSARLTGSVAPHSGAADVVFQYGTTASYGGTAAASSLPAGDEAIAVGATVGGLAPGTTYHYRAVARRGGQSYPGADATFTTAAAIPPPIAPPPPPPPQPPPPPVATATSLLGKTLKANRKGFFKVKVAFGDAVPAGKARITVSRKRKRLARARTNVRQGRTVTKTLRLNRKGRKAIRRGHAKNVTLELRLPGGQKIKKTVKLKRRR